MRPRGGATKARCWEVTACSINRSSDVSTVPRELCSPNDSLLFGGLVESAMCPHVSAAGGAGRSPQLFVAFGVGCFIGPARGRAFNVVPRRLPLERERDPFLIE